MVKKQAKVCKFKWAHIRQLHGHRKSGHLSDRLRQKAPWRYFTFTFSPQTAIEENVGFSLIFFKFTDFLDRIVTHSSFNMLNFKDRFRRAFNYICSRKYIYFAHVRGLFRQKLLSDLPVFIVSISLACRARAFMSKEICPTHIHPSIHPSIN